MGKQDYLKSIPIDRISFGERVRQHYTNVEQLASSIDSCGLIHPVSVLKLDSSEAKDTDSSYLLVAGGRRIRAYQFLGHTEIPAIVTDDDDEIRPLIRELVENLQRESMTPFEELSGLRKIHALRVAQYGKKISTNPDAPGISMSDTARFLGIDPSTMSKDLDLHDKMLAIPALQKAATKHEARKIVVDLRKEVTQRASLVYQVQKQRETFGITPDEAKRKKQLIHCYRVGKLIDNDLTQSGFFEWVNEKHIADNDLDLIEFDSPYGDNEEQFKASMHGTQSAKSSMKDYQEFESSDYPRLARIMLKEAYRVLRPDRWCLFWFANKYHGLIRDIAKDVGFAVPNMPIFWLKPSGPSPTPNYRLSNRVDVCYYFAKGSPTLAKPGSDNILVYNRVPESKRIHTMEHPVELLVDLYSRFHSGWGKVWIPFLGSGNGLLACANLGFVCFGNELSMESKKRFTLRVNGSTYGKYTTLE